MNKETRKKINDIINNLHKQLSEIEDIKEDAAPIVIVVRGGIVQDVITEIGTKVCIIDWDNIEAGDKELHFSYPVNYMTEDEISDYIAKTKIEIKDK